MAEVTTRGGGLPRGGPPRGRGRGRGAHHSSHHGSMANGSEHKTSGHRSHQTRGSNPASDAQEPEELKNIRRKHGHNLSTIRELFPSWTDEDLLMALNEAGGDLELAAARISEGLTEQWGAVKTKKDKKTTLPSSAHNARPHNIGPNSASTPGRGRGESTRGSSRSGRGAAPRGVGRASGTSQPSHPLTSSDELLTNNATPSAWSLGPPTSLVSNGPAADASAGVLSGLPGIDVLIPADLSSQFNATVPASTQPLGGLKHDAANERPTSGYPLEPINPSPEPVKKPTSRVIAPGTKISWAQIARPADPPKPTLVPVGQPSAYQDAAARGSSDSQSTGLDAAQSLSTVGGVSRVPQQALDSQVTITIPEATADVWHTEPVPVIDELNSSANSTGPNVWNDDPVLQPLGVGEGWAETVLAQPTDSKSSIFDKQAAGSGSILLTPSDAVNIAPIEMATSSPASALDPPVISSIPSDVSTPEHSHQTAEATLRVPGSTQTTTTAGTSSILAPPGLTKRVSARKGQEAAVVMPGTGTPNLDRVGLKFGSLSLFGETQDNIDASAPPLDALSPPAPALDDKLIPESRADERTIEPNASPPQASVEPVPSPPVATAIEEKLPLAPSSAAVNYNSTSSHAAAHSSSPQPNSQSSQSAPHPQSQTHNPPSAQPPSSSAQQPSSALNTRYPSTHPYNSVDPSVHATSSLSQVTAGQQQDAFTHYAGFRQDPMSVYLQQQQSAVAQHSVSPVPTSQSPASYSSFSHMNPQSAHQSQQPAQGNFGQVTQSAAEYAALYGQEALRSLNYYDSYAHAQAAQQAAFQSRSSHGADESKSGTTQSALSQGQPPQLVHHQPQHHHQQPQPQQPQPSATTTTATNQQYPGMQPSPMPYPYYPYYQQYGQLPPNYQNPAYPYGLQGHSPYYSGQGSQQYPVAGTRAAQNQYPMQVGPGSNATAGGSLPNSQSHQQQHHHGLAGAGMPGGNAGFRQVSQPGVGASQIAGAQVAGQGVVAGNSGLAAPGSAGVIPQGQQSNSIHHQHPYYASGYGSYGSDPQQNQTQSGTGSTSANAGHHQHHHHHSQQQQQPQHGSRQPSHHSQHHQNQGQNANVGQGGQGSNERKDPFAFSDRFFNQ